MEEKIILNKQTKLLMVSEGTCTVYHKDIGVGLFHNPCINLSVTKVDWQVSDRESCMRHSHVCCAVCNINYEFCLN